MRKILLCFILLLTFINIYADSAGDQSGSLSNVGYSSTNVVIPLQGNSSSQQAIIHSPANEFQNNFSNLGNKKRKGVSVNLSRDDDVDCSDTTNQCSFKPRPLTVQQANQRGKGVVSQPNNNWGVQIQRQK